MESRKLYRSRSDKMLAGVCGGLSNYLNLDATVVRLLFVLLFFLGGHGLLIYLILWILMPIEPQLTPAPYVNTDTSGVAQ
jgi:phage shock protein C